MRASEAVESQSQEAIFEYLMDQTGVAKTDGHLYGLPAIAASKRWHFRKREDDMVDQMTNAQKVKVITGQGVTSANVTWPGLVSKDGVAGINQNFL